jgi:hypothetical protein
VALERQITSVSDLVAGTPAGDDVPVFDGTAWRPGPGPGTLPPSPGPAGSALRMGAGGPAWGASAVSYATDYGADRTGVADSTPAIQAALDAAFAAGGGTVFLPTGTYRTTTWLLVRSNVSVRGDGADSVIFNDKTNPTIDKRACLLVGNHHPALMASQTGYGLNAIAAGDSAVTCTTAGDAATFADGQLVVVGSATNLSGVSRHAQLTKVAGTPDAGVVTLVDPIEAAIADGKIWTIGGTDPSTGTAVYAAENVAIADLGFKGRAAIATKGASYRATFRNLWMLDTHLFFGTNMLSNCLIENLHGQFSGRYLEFAMNSYNVTARNWHGRFRPPTGLQAGEAMVFPIHLGEQPFRILLDDVQCHLDARYTPNTELAQVKGSKIAVRSCDWRHGGASGSAAVTVPDCAYAGFNYDGIVFDECRLDAGSKARVVQVGGAAVAAENPQDVHFRGGELLGTPSGESIWFQTGRGCSCSMRDRTGKAVKVSTTARYPMLSGYRRG